MPVITDGELRAIVDGLSRSEWPSRVAIARDLLDARRDRDDALRVGGEWMQQFLRVGNELEREHADLAKAHSQLGQMMQERDTLRAVVERLREVLRGLLLSRDAAWTGGHDWHEAVEAAIDALAFDATKPTTTTKEGA